MSDYVRVQTSSHYGDDFAAVLSKSYSPSEFARFLNSKTIFYGSCASDTMTELLKKSEDLKLCRFVPTNHNYCYTFNWKGYVLEMIVSQRGMEIFRGTINQFVSWSTNPWDKFVGKVVKFYYSGGSKIGDRTIRVEKVHSDGLEGLDLEEPDLTQAYRKYLKSKMGNVQLIN